MSVQGVASLLKGSSGGKSAPFYHDKGNAAPWGKSSPFFVTTRATLPLWGKSAPFTPLQSASGPGSTSQSSRLLGASRKRRKAC